MEGSVLVLESSNWILFPCEMTGITSKPQAPNLKPNHWSFGLSLHRLEVEAFLRFEFHVMFLSSTPVFGGFGA